MDGRRRRGILPLLAALLLGASCGAPEGSETVEEPSNNSPSVASTDSEPSPPPDVASPPECASGLSVASVSGAGRIVILRDRSTWEVDQIDRIDTREWSRSERISVCGSKMTNLTRSHHVTVARVPAHSGKDELSHPVH